MKKDILELFKAARRVSTPFVAIETPDQRDLSSRIFKAVGNGENPAPKFTFDLARGLVAINEPAKGIVAGIEDDFVGNPAGVLVAAQMFPQGSIIVMFNAQRYIDDGMVMQAICNLRDEFKTNRRTLVPLGPSFRLGPELSDVVVFDEPLPDDDQLRDILHKTSNAAPALSPEDVIVEESSAVDAARGLPAFLTEQVYAMALQKDGSFDDDSIWLHKKAIVDKTTGLTFFRGGPTFDQLGGLDSIKEYMRQIMNGRWPFGCIVFLDEGEKATSASESDSTGVSQDLMGTWLSWMDGGGLAGRAHDGLIAAGGPGTGKTALGMAIGATFGIPTIVMDVGAFRQKHVGESEANVRNALKVIDSVAGERGAFVYMTCNKIARLLPEFKRRFRKGTWYFDPPSAAEKPIIWNIHLVRNKMVGGIHMRADKPDDAGWTGSEIRNCVETAYQLDIGLDEASRYVVPVAKSDPDAIVALRKAAHGRWLSASYPGSYVGAIDQEQKKQERAVEFER